MTTSNDTHTHRTAPRFPDPNTQPMAGRILFCLLLRQRVAQGEVGLGQNVPRYLTHLRELQTLGWRMGPAMRGSTPTKNGAVELLDPDGMYGVSAERFADTVVRSPAGAAWVEAMARLIKAECGR